MIPVEGIKAQYEAQDDESGQYVKDKPVVEMKVVGIGSPTDAQYTMQEALVLAENGRVQLAHAYRPPNGDEEGWHYIFVGLVGAGARIIQEKKESGPDFGRVEVGTKP